MRRNTSKVAKPYDIDVSVEQSVNKDYASGENYVEAGNAVKTDMPEKYEDSDGRGILLQSVRKN